MHHSVGARALASEIGDKVLLLVDGREDNIEAYGWAQVIAVDTNVMSPSTDPDRIT